MKISILAARRQRAIESITESSGLDLSSSAFPKTPDVAHRELLILERIAEHMKEAGGAAESEQTDTEAILERVESVDGIGPATMVKIREAVYGADE